MTRRTKQSPLSIAKQGKVASREEMINEEVRNDKLNIAESTRWTEQMKRSIMHCHVIMAGESLLIICFHSEGEKHTHKKK